MNDPVLRLAADIGMVWDILGRKTLSCAPDVEAALHRFTFETSVTWGDTLVSVMGIEVNVAWHYEPGQWKLVLHDHCELIAGGENPGDAMIASHAMCTVMDCEPLECQGS